MEFVSDEEKFALLKERLFSAALSDALDTLGRREQVMRHNIRPLDSASVVCGRARTWLWKDAGAMGNAEFQSVFKDMSEIAPHEVIVHSTDYGLEGPESLHSCAALGDTMGKTMANRGCAGVVADRLVRDAQGLVAIGLPVFCRGNKPNRSASRAGIAAFGVPIRCGDVLVNPGDVIFGDYDGIVVIPQEIENDVIDTALAILVREAFFHEGLAVSKPVFQVIEEWNALHPDKPFDEWKGLHPNRVKSW